MSPKLGLAFSESMTGGFALGVADPAAGAKQGRAQSSQLSLHCDVTIDNLQSFVDDPQHPGRLDCTVDFPAFGAGIRCDPGTFNLFRAANTAGERWMVYDCGFVAKGRRYHIAGKKIVQHGHAAEVLQQITSCRGAMNGLLAVVLEDHIRNHLVDAHTDEDPAGSATEQLIEVVHSYFK